VRETPVALWDALDTTEWSAVRTMNTTRLQAREVDEFCQRWHYTATKGSAPWSYGLWDGPTLVGAVAYNLPTMETCASVFGPEHWRSVAHMGRLVCAERTPPNVESRLIAASLRLLPIDRPGTLAVLTYAAQDVGHIGYVYQATNALYTGLTESTHHHHIDPQGRRRGDYLGGAYVDTARAADLGWTRHEGQPKHRYLYLVGTPAQRRHSRRRVLLPSLPYPKGGVGR
jgi:hypothetical protein